MGHTAEGRYAHDEESGDGSISRAEALERVRSAYSINMSPELFEKLYLSPKTAVKGELRRTFGNPTPGALIAFCMALTPLSCDFMGWRSAGGGGSASTGIFLLFSGPLLFITGIMEWVLGNTFSFAVFTTYGGFCMAVAGTIIPWFNSAGAYSSTGTDFFEGLESPAFNSSFAFALIMMAVLNVIFLVGSIKTNAGLFIIFLTAVPGFVTLAASHWKSALGELAAAKSLTVASGALFFVCTMVGWYLLAAQILESVGFPFQLPVGDISHLLSGRKTTGA